MRSMRRRTRRTSQTRGAREPELDRRPGCPPVAKRLRRRPSARKPACASCILLCENGRVWRSDLLVLVLSYTTTEAAVQLLKGRLAEPRNLWRIRRLDWGRALELGQIALSTAVIRDRTDPSPALCSCRDRLPVTGGAAGRTGPGPAEPVPDSGTEDKKEDGSCSNRSFTR